MKRVRIKIPFEYFEEENSPEKGYFACPHLREGASYLLEDDYGMPKGFCPKAWKAVQGAVNAIASGSSFMTWNNRDGYTILCCPEESCSVLFEITSFDSKF